MSGLGGLATAFVLSAQVVAFGTDVVVITAFQSFFDAATWAAAAPADADG